MAPAKMTPSKHTASVDEIVAGLHRNGWIKHDTVHDAIFAMNPEELRDIISQYQKFHGLPSTGIACKPTVRHLSAQRCCSHPDVMAMTMADLGKWPVPDLTWHLDEGAAFNGIDRTTALTALEWAFGQWSLVCGIKATRIDERAKSHILIDCQNIDTPGGMLAYSQMADNTMGQKIQRFDHQETWCFHPGSDIPHNMTIDLGRVACHELGHVLGIPHIEASNLMQPMYSYSVWFPAKRDIEEAQARYGPPRR